MTTSDREFEMTDANVTDKAWERIRQTLEREPASAAWEALERRAMEAGQEGLRAEQAVHPAPAEELVKADAAGEMPRDLRIQADSRLASGEAAAVSGPAAVMKKEEAPAAARRVRNGRMRRWTAAAVVAATVLAVTVTPAGSKALASILGTFRMEKVTEVNQADMEQLFNSVFQSGVTDEQINRYGEFRVKTGTQSGGYSRDQAEALTGVKLLPESQANDGDTFYVSADSEISLKLNVKEINKTMRQLGATKLFPSSVDGKEVTLVTEPAVNYMVKLNGIDEGVQISQMKAPKVKVDPSVDVQDALDTVLQFPLLPEALRNSLSAGNLLENGELPLPVMTEGQSTRLEIDGVPVILTENSYGDHYHSWNAIWVKDGIMTTATVSNGSGGQAEQIGQAFRDKLGELVEP